MIYTRTYLRTDNQAPVNFDLGEHEPIPPEAWRLCGGVAHLVKRRVVQTGTRYSTVAECTKCGAIIETVEHPLNSRSYPDQYKVGPSCTDLVIAYLREHGPSRGRALADALDLTHQAVNKALVRATCIEKVGEEFEPRNGRSAAVWGIAL